MRSSEKTVELSKALVMLERDMHNPPKSATAKVKTKTGADFSYSYATLPDILDQVRPKLHANGLAVVQDEVTEDGKVGVVSRVMHVSGEWLEVGPLLLPAGVDAQSAGSALTYARRYALCGLLGIAADEDDDGAKTKRSSKKSESWGDSVPAPKKTSGGEGGEPGTSSSETTSSGGDDGGARSSDEGSGSRTVSPPVQPLEDDPSLDTPATDDHWGRAIGLGWTGTKVLKRARELFPETPPKTQSEVTKRMLAVVMLEAMNK